VLIKVELMTDTAMVDVHCHLSSEAFSSDLAAVLERARQAGVTRIISVGENLTDNLRVLALVREYPAVLAALGHYPDLLDEQQAAANEALIRQHRPQLVAMGEVGIDHWIAKEPEDRERQHAVFLRFVHLARELDLPLSVHSRSAGHHALRLLTEAGAQRVCLHAFDGKAGYAQQAAEAGYYLSVPPSVVRSEQKRKLVAAVPLSRLLLESDAPVLGPDREQRNEPANILLAVAAIAEIKSVAPAEVIKVCLENTVRLFGAEVLGS
jgi:TatD DNase family protein